MDPIRESQLVETRRHFFGRSAAGIGTAALASLLNPELFAAKGAPHRSNEVISGMPNLPHFAAKAKRVIYLFMSGAPSQLDMWDYKPKMQEWYDKDLPDSVRNGQRITTMSSGQKRFPIAPSIFKFKQHGGHGAWVSELLPHTAGIVDELSVIKTINTEAINHDPAITYIQMGSQIPGRPSTGAWLSYGLGSMNQNLPAFVVLHSTVNGSFGGQALYARLWGAGFLSTRHQGGIVDHPCAALIRDLKQRGMLDDTLVIWGGEFGRTIYCQGSLCKTNYGRDHHPRCYTKWMAGGGIKPGVVYGETDDFSYNVTRDPVHIHDLNATILHCLGIDHDRLTFRHQGRDFRLTDVHGKLVKGILA